MKLPAHPVKTGQARLGLPGNVDMITRSAFLPAYKAGHPADLPVNLSAPQPKGRGLLEVHPEPCFSTPPSNAGLRTVERVRCLVFSHLQHSPQRKEGWGEGEKGDG